MGEACVGGGEDELWRGYLPGREAEVPLLVRALAMVEIPGTVWRVRWVAA